MKTAAIFGLYIMGIVKEGVTFQRELMAVLVIFVFVDYLTEIMLMIFRKKHIPVIQIKSIVKKCAIFIVVFLSSIIDIYILRNGAVISTATTLFYISCEGIAVLKNVLKMGVPFPKILKNVLEQMKDSEKFYSSND